MGVFVVFSGLDCSGKSTQIELLKEKYKKEKQKHFVFWSRGGYTPGFQKLKDILRRLSGKKLPKPGFTPQREKALASPFIRKVWLTIAMMDLLYYYVVFLRIKKLLNYNIICDRYLMDTNIDFMLTYPKEKTQNWFLWRILELFALKPDFHFVSTIPVHESVIRSKFKFEPYPDSPGTLNKRLDLYNFELKNNSNLIFIDGLRDRYEIREQINKIISNTK